MNRLFLLIALLGSGSTAFAADDEKIIYPREAAPVAAPILKSSGMGSASLMIGLMLAGAGGWLVWRHRNSTPMGREARVLAINETRSLGNRQFLVVASYQDRKFLLGVCPGRIDLLAPLDGTALPEKKAS